MGKNKYVGHRYVPKIDGEWDKSKQYESLTVVLYQGASYTSRQNVPVGVEITNEEFWVLTGNYNAQVEQYQQEVNAQLAQTRGQFHIADTYVTQAIVSPKAIYNNLNTIFVVTPKPHGNGYLRVKLQENVVTTTESAGSPGELLRVTGIDNVLDCFIIQAEEYQNSGLDAWVTRSVAYVLPSGENQTLETRQIDTRSAGAWIEYKLNIPSGITNVDFLIYGTNGSSTDVEVMVDGSSVIDSTSFQRNPASWFTISVPVIPGERIIRFITKTSQYMSLGGAYLELNNFKKGFTYDNIITFHQSSNKYVSSNGAMDYALFDSDDNQWVGSYHGGETRERLMYLLDGVEITLDESEKYVGNVLEIEQGTDILNKIKVYSRQIFEHDGSIEHEVIFNGDINLTRMFTNMSTTADSFNDILYPVRHTLSDTGNFYLPEGVNYIVQRDSSNNQKAITILNNNMIPYEKVPKPYIKKTPGAYNKVYNANIDSDTPINFTGGNFRTVHIFE